MHIVSSPTSALYLAYANLLFLLFSLQTESSIAIYSATSRGRMQLIYGGQPFIFEKTLKLSTGEEKRYWRCNQWWNQKCRSRVFTINDIVMPLNRYHTHEEIVRRKKRVRRVPPATAEPVKDTPLIVQPDDLDTETILNTSLEEVSPDASELGMHLKYEEIVADVTGMVETRIVCRKK